MSYGYPNSIGAIPNTDSPDEDIVVRPYEAGESITAGNCLRLGNNSESSSYTPGKTAMQGDANKLCIGLALNSASAGGIVHVQTWGRNQVAVSTGQAQAAGAVSYLGASGATLEQATWTSLEPENVLSIVGYGLAADSGAVGAVDTLFVCPYGGAK